MIKCIAIDDEPLALRQMEKYIGQTPFLELLGLYENAMEAYAVLSEKEVDLIFVDIDMPDINGMDFVKTLQNAPMVIFTTAYAEYAVESYRVNAVDYLLKPFDYTAFLKAAQKALQQFDHTSKEQENNGGFLYVKSEYKVLRITLSDIKYIEGMRDYVKIFLEGQKPVMSLISMKAMQERLPREKFMRIHRSYIVNLEKVDMVERQRIIFDKDKYIPVGDQYKEEFQQFIQKNGMGKL
jgi:two-component system LytT family response regulator